MNLERMTGFNDPMPLTLGPAVRRVEPEVVKQDVPAKHREGLVTRPDGTLAYDPFKDTKNAPAPKVLWDELGKQLQREYDEILGGTYRLVSFNPTKTADEFHHRFELRALRFNGKTMLRSWAFKDFAKEKP